MRTKDDIKSLFRHKFKVSFQRGQKHRCHGYVLNMQQRLRGELEFKISVLRGIVTKSAERGNYKARQMTDWKI